MVTTTHPFDRGGTPWVYGVCAPVLKTLVTIRTFTLLIVNHEDGGSEIGIAGVLPQEVLETF